MVEVSEQPFVEHIEWWIADFRRIHISECSSFILLASLSNRTTATMKFGQNLPRNQVPEWASSYVEQLEEGDLETLYTLPHILYTMLHMHRLKMIGDTF